MSLYFFLTNGVNAMKSDCLAISFKFNQIEECHAEQRGVSGPYLVELAQGGDEIGPLRGGLEISQRLFDDCPVTTVTIVILQLQLLGIHGASVWSQHAQNNTSGEEERVKKRSWLITGQK